MKNFKTLEKLQRLIKLYEAQAEDPNAVPEEDPEMMDDGTGEAPVDSNADPNADPNAAVQPDPTDAADNGADSDPENQANPEDGIFISDIKKAEFAKLLITALMNKEPEAGSIPQEMLNVTKDNADNVIQYVQSLLSLDSSLSTDNEADEDGFANSVKEV